MDDSIGSGSGQCAQVFVIRPVVRARDTLLQICLFAQITLQILVSLARHGAAFVDK